MHQIKDYRPVSAPQQVSWSQPKRAEQAEDVVKAFSFKFLSATQITTSSIAFCFSPRHSRPLYIYPCFGERMLSRSLVSWQVLGRLQPPRPRDNAQSLTIHRFLLEQQLDCLNHAKSGWWSNYPDSELPTDQLIVGNCWNSRKIIIILITIIRHEAYFTSISPATEKYS